MDNNITKKQNAFISEEEKTLNWEDIQATFKKTFGTEVYNSWLQKISLVKEYNDYLILGVPTRFFRDWIVSRYLDKILEQMKTFKLSLIASVPEFTPIAYLTFINLANLSSNFFNGLPNVKSPVGINSFKLFQSSGQLENCCFKYEYLTFI